jgi:S-formylglutathione hydrolase
MFEYVTNELPALVAANLPADTSRQSISGHSMGGHGALICALKNAGKYRSVSAFAPISNPINCAWGKKAFSGYFGSDDQSVWKEWDATELSKVYAGPKLPVLVSQVC